MRHVVTTRRHLPTLAVGARSESRLVEMATDGEWDPTTCTLSFDLGPDDLRALAAGLAGSRYITARFDATSQRRNVTPRDVCVYLLDEGGDIVCAATAEDAPDTVNKEIRRVTEEIEALTRVRTSLIQRGHDLGTSDRGLAAYAKLSHPRIATLHRGERTAHRLQGDAIQALHTAGIPTDESVRVYSTTDVDEIDNPAAPRTWVPSVRVGVHSNGEVRLATGQYQTIDQGRDCVALIQRAAELLKTVPTMTLRLEHKSRHSSGNEHVDLPVYVISWDSLPAIDDAPDDDLRPA
ncbi:hypothetical protein [Streptomyces endocoffeicus]|uniref:hypothetical protein n=1 Tax=Streptomyces endocoffeicus TaxID=2898945 RepID=UPI001E490365|nr:hypothetical protein [Streptomyces endocoffeicus]